MSGTEFEKTLKPSSSTKAESKQKATQKLAKAPLGHLLHANVRRVSDLIGAKLETDVHNNFVMQLKDGRTLAVDAVEDMTKGIVELILKTRPVTYRVLLVGHNENVKPTAALIERRLRNLRQVYASLFIAYALHEQQAAFSEEAVDKSKDDLEQLLPIENHLVVVGAGIGTFWLALQAGGEAVAGAIKKAPKAALLTTCLLFTSTREKALRIMEAKTRTEEERSKQAAIETEKARVELEGLKTAQEKAHDEMIAAKINLGTSAERAALELRGIRNAQDRDQLEAFTKALQVFDGLKDEGLKDKLRQTFTANARGLLGPNADLMLPSPPSPPPPGAGLQ